MNEAMRRNGRDLAGGAILFAVVAAIVLAADQLTKLWVLNTLAPPFHDVPHGRIITIIPGLLRFQYAENMGAAFSLFDDHPRLLTIIASALAAAVLIWHFFLPAGERLSRVGLAMIFGGAVGNLVDRFRYGYVVDFIVAHYKGYAWPTFNLADSSICIGIAVFLISSLVAAHQEKQNEQPAE